MSNGNLVLVWGTKTKVQFWYRYSSRNFLSLPSACGILVWKHSCLYFDQNSSQKQKFKELRSHLFFHIGNIDKFQGRRCYHISSKNLYYTIRWLHNSSRILIRILFGNISGKYIQWLQNSLRISIRILVGNAAVANPLDDIRVPENSLGLVFLQPQLWVAHEMMFKGRSGYRGLPRFPLCLMNRIRICREMIFIYSSRK